MMLVTVSFIIFCLGLVFKSRSARRIVRPLRNNTGQTLVHHAMWYTSNETLFTPLLIFQEQGNMETMNRREPDDYRSSINTRFAMIHFLETRLHGRLKLERGAVWFLKKEPWHWMIHFPKTCLHGIRNPSRTWSLRLHKPSALFPQCSPPCCSCTFVLCSDAASIIVCRACAPTLLLPWLCHDRSAPDGVGHGHRWPHRWIVIWPMDDLASLRATCSFMHRVCGTIKVA
jgi:hypothetical protein